MIVTYMWHLTNVWPGSRNSIYYKSWYVSKLYLVIGWTWEFIEVSLLLHLLSCQWESGVTAVMGDREVAQSAMNEHGAMT